MAPYLGKLIVNDVVENRVYKKVNILKIPVAVLGDISSIDIQNYS